MTKDEALSNLRQAVQYVLDTQGAIYLANSKALRKAINWCFHARITLAEARTIVSEEVVKWLATHYL